MPFTVYFDDVTFDANGDFETKPEAYSYEKPELGDENGSADIFRDDKKGLLSSLFGKSVPDYLRLTPDDKEVLKAFLPALKAAGVKTCEMSYDGGNDEGFGQMERCQDADGNEITIDALLANESFLKQLEAYVTARFETNRHPIFTMDKTPMPLDKMVRDYLDYELAVILVSALIGRGYGTGEYQLYGRATLDLDAMTVTDDPNAPYPDGSSL